MSTRWNRGGSVTIEFSYGLPRLFNQSTAPHAVTVGQSIASLSGEARLEGPFRDAQNEAREQGRTVAPTRTERRRSGAGQQSRAAHPSLDRSRSRQAAHRESASVTAPSTRRSAAGAKRLAHNRLARTGDV